MNGNGSPWNAAFAIAAAAAAVGFSMRIALAQQPAAGAGGPTHVAPIRQNTTIQAPHFLKSTPAKERPISLAGPNAMDRNAVAVPALRHDAAPAAPLAGRVAGHVAVRSIVPVRWPAQPPVSSRNAIGGASFTRPVTALVPLGGPAKFGAANINGTSIRPKH